MRWWWWWWWWWWLEVLKISLVMSESSSHSGEG
ncbi:hypothetical protein E2C01_083244 [Portunus trituberculatus]|uniref:Uncharacterized protein n=1 Tax=Portunus trituberculatus TaxID=210409 RepID=A0A5B7J1G5_PORTR|nr:hypothetical protein [Portunus trituberculatus]